MSKRNAAVGFLAVSLIVLIYHIFIIAGLIPGKYVWGGQFNDSSSLIKLEVTAIIIQMIMAAIVYTGTWVNYPARFKGVFVFSFLILGIFFVLNTVGNLLAAHLLETIVFTPLTVLSAIFTIRLAYLSKRS